MSVVLVPNEMALAHEVREFSAVVATSVTFAGLKNVKKKRSNEDFP
jgi:hypothetical protein